jgi:hypothetical protein
MNHKTPLVEIEKVANSPEAHYCIGKSENFSEHIGGFLLKHSDDPSIKACRSPDIEVINIEIIPTTPSGLYSQTQTTSTSSHKGYDTPGDFDERYRSACVASDRY